MTPLVPRTAPLDAALLFSAGFCVVLALTLIVGVLLAFSERLLVRETDALFVGAFDTDAVAKRRAAGIL